MEPSFWQQRWVNNQIAFHETDGNSLLVKHFEKLSLAAGQRVFLPLCGKTRDIAWLLSRGYRVAGAELVELAIEQLFEELGATPHIEQTHESKRYSAENLDIFVGDLFALSREMLGPVDAVYDRAALVALPAAMRARYAAHLAAVTGGAPQLLLTFEYDQSRLDGPPFSVGETEIERHYSACYDVVRVESVPVPGRLKGKVDASEMVWLLKQR